MSGNASQRRLLLLPARLMLGVVLTFVVAQLNAQAPAEVPAADLAAEWRNVAAWPLERITLRDGRTFGGLILRADDETIELDEVRRPPGRVMYLIKRRFPTVMVTATERLDETERRQLAERLDRYRNRSLEELQNMAEIRLAPDPHDAELLRYGESNWFTLASYADEELTRRAIVRIERMFTAFAAILPPAPRQPATNQRVALTIRLYDTNSDYRAFQQSLGLGLSHQAFYLREKDVLAAGADLDALARNLSVVRQRNATTRQSIKQLTAEMPLKLQEAARGFQQQGRTSDDTKQLIGLLRAGMQRELTGLQDQLSLAERKNSAEFENFTRRMFQSLYHEAFHAYLDHYVFPPDQYDVPRWLNEGLAQVFEEGVLEAGTLRLDIPSRDRLQALQRELRAADRLPLEEVLTAEPQRYLVAHDAARRDSERLYLYSWGLAYYLVIREPVLQTDRLRGYVRPAAARLAPRTRFEELLGQSLTEFEPRWRREILETPVP